jgi:hypothetical protein
MQRRGLQKLPQAAPGTSLAACGASLPGAAMSINILVTGGAGFIGSHTCVALIEAGLTPVVIDNLCNADAYALVRIAQVTDTASLPRFGAATCGTARC